MNISTTFHLQIDGQAEHIIQTLEDMVRPYVIDFKGKWDDHLPLIEFDYNNNYHASIQMASYEALCGTRYRFPIGWFEVGEAGLIGSNLVHQAMEKVKVIQEKLKQRRVAKSSTHTLEEGHYMRFGRKGKLCPRYIGPYRISKRLGNVAYELELSQELEAVHLVFHISMLKKCFSVPSLIVPTENVGIKDNLPYEEVPVHILDRQVRKLRTKEVALVKVLWRNQFVEKSTWEVEEDISTSL